MQARFKKFTLEEANRLLPEIIALTRETIARLDAARRQREADVLLHGEPAEVLYQKLVNSILENWAQAVAERGVMPKGFFTCDFVTPNPERYFCWTYGETEISHTHRVTETFKDRVPIENPRLQGFEVSLN